MRIRPTVRLIVVDAERRILLFRYVDAQPWHRDFPGMTEYWATPGGGVEVGESLEQAGIRELFEETGLRLTALGQHLWHSERVLIFPDRSVCLDEHFYLAQVHSTQIDISGMLPYELDVYRGHRWWTLDELQATNDVILPPQLVTIATDVMA